MFLDPNCARAVAAGTSMVVMAHGRSLSQPLPHLSLRIMSVHLLKANTCQFSARIDRSRETNPPFLVSIRHGLRSAESRQFGTRRTSDRGDRVVSRLSGLPELPGLAEHQRERASDIPERLVCLLPRDVGVDQQMTLISESPVPT